MNPTKIHRRLKAFYGDGVIDRFTANRWAVKFRDCDSGKDIIVILENPRKVSASLLNNWDTVNSVHLAIFIFFFYLREGTRVKAVTMR